MPAAVRSDDEDDETGRLLRAIAVGRDRNAFRRLYDAQAPFLFGVALRLLRDRAAAADAVQEAFIQVWRNAGRYDPSLGSGRAWLTGIVRYRALDLARARGREVAEPEPISAEHAEDRPGPLDLLAARQEGSRLAECLETLADKNRRMIILAFVDGFSHGQIAARLDVPLGTVKSWIRRGLLALRDCLEA
jgi:RNA polymerase sigma-70 factor (ECF subfamily)